VGETAQRKLLSKMVNDPTHLATALSPQTGDPILFDNLNTPSVVESKRQIAAQALLETLAYLRGRLGATLSVWRWGQVHTLTLEFPGGINVLNIPAPDDAMYKNGYPRHGDDGTVDVGGHGLSLVDFTYSEGPAIRFVCELDPAGPKARNVLPGGEVFDPSSPHYSDQMALWRQNQTFDLAFTDADVLQSAMKEYQTNQIGRTRFTP
jgi:penicillin amidase